MKEIWRTKGRICAVTENDEVTLILEVAETPRNAYLTIAGRRFPVNLTIALPRESLKTLVNKLKEAGK